MANVVTEIENIIESTSFSLREKLNALELVDTARRPGKEKADGFRLAFLLRIRDRRNTLLTNHSPSRTGFVRLPNGAVKHETANRHGRRNDWAINRDGDGLKRKNPQYYESASANWAVENHSKTRFQKHIESLSPRYSSVVKHLGSVPDCVPASKRAEYRLAFLAKEVEMRAFEAEVGLPYGFAFGKQADILTCQSNGSVDVYRAKVSYCKASGHYFIVRHDETEDWEKYSKSWHNQHGAYREVTKRYIQVLKGGQEVAQIEIESFRGGYLVNAIAQYLGIEKVKIQRSLKPVQMGDFFEVEKIRSLGGVSLYRRVFGGELVDFCATGKGENFHADTLSGAIAGLRGKIEKAAAAEAQRVEKENTVLTAQHCIETYGFCAAGIQEFCDLNELDFNVSYTVRQIREKALERKRENCAKFSSDLKKIGVILNCK